MNQREHAALYFVALRDLDLDAADVDDALDAAGLDASCTWRAAMDACWRWRTRLDVSSTVPHDSVAVGFQE